MQHTYICVKCDSSDVIEIKGNSLSQSSTIALTKWSMKTAILDRYICANCGYTEEYIQMNQSFLKWAEKQVKNAGRLDSDIV